MKLSPARRGYLAGLIDADGAIVVWRARCPRGYRYALRLTITNTDRKVVDWLLEHCGGRSHYCERTHAYAKNWKREWRWSCSGLEAGRILRICVPYMVCKKERALLGLQFASTLKRAHRVLSEDIQATRQELYAQMRAKNKRGNSNADSRC